MAEDEHPAELPSWYQPSATPRPADTSTPAERAWPANDAWPAPTDPSPAPVTAPATNPAPRVEPTPEPQPGGAGWSVRTQRAAPQHEWEVLATAPPVPEFAPGAPPAGAPPAGAPLPWDAPPPRANPTAARRLGIVALGVLGFGVVGVAAVGAGSLFHGGPSLIQPQSIGALPLIPVPQVDSAMQNIPQDLKGYGVTKTVFGLYGASGQPQLAFYAAQGSTLPGDIRRFYESYAVGLRSTGFSVDTAAATVSPISGINFICGPVSAPAPLSKTLSACVWVDGGIAGTVIDMTGQSVPETLNEAVQARAASEH